MTEGEALVHILTRSVERNGEKPLTNKYLLNIVKMTLRYMEHNEMANEAALNQFWDEDNQWGSG
jgi:hypothetical protein